MSLELECDSQFFERALQRGDLVFGDGHGGWAEAFAEEARCRGMLAETFEQLGRGQREDHDSRGLESALRAMISPARRSCTAGGVSPPVRRLEPFAQSRRGHAAGDSPLQGIAA